MVMLNDLPGGGGLGSLSIQLSSRSMSSSTANASELTPVGGAGLVIAQNVGGTPGTLTTRTPALMIGDGALYVGQTWYLILCNFQGTGVLTLAAGSGAVVGGTATVAINTARLFTGTVTSATVVTFTGLAFAWTGAV